jgi:alkanesulfonate monooxygenase SsuD/methylene tetrahydromethanopterin reductase-like flavin-dependent oxidoreductase (luciferase family)
MKRKYWEIVQAMPSTELESTVRRFEELELDGVWVPQLHSPPFVTLAAIAMCSKRIKLGTGIALAFTRSLTETALSAVDLDRISGGRVVLGLGTGVRTWNERAHGIVYGKPVEHLREVVQTVRSIIEQGHTGELGAIDGKYHKLDLKGFTNRKPLRDTIPIYVPALFENTVLLAARVADGLLGHPVWSIRWIAEQAERVDKTLAANGRKRDQFHVNLWNYAAISSNRKQAIDDMRGTVAFYTSVAQYQKYYAAHGFGAEANAVIEASLRNDPAAMLKAVPDEMVTTFAIAGTPDDARERVEKMWQYADSMTLSPPQYFVGGNRLGEYRTAIAETFYRS